MKTAVVTFGRVNPPTTGHSKLVQRVISEAKKRKATPMVFLSHSYDKKKNPLSYEQKIKYAQKAFGKIVIKSNARTIIEVCKQLESKFDNLVLVVGSDRVENFKSLLEKYNGKEYSFKSIEVVSAGERDPDADDVSGMSASKMRALAAANNLAQFKKGLPPQLQKNAADVLRDVRSGMGLSEQASLWHRIRKYLNT